VPDPRLPTPDDVVAVLRGVIDPELGSDIVELGMAKGAVVEPDGNVIVTIALTTSGCPLRAQIQRDVRSRVGSLPGVTHVKLDWTEMTQEEKSSAMAKARWNVAQRPEDTTLAPTTRVVLVASGKGGVGKSSVTVNLAAAMAATGLKVGVLDADIWGFSVPRMLGISGRLAAEERDGKKQMIPHERAIDTARLATFWAARAGVVTTSTSARGSSLATPICTSPVPGGMSTKR
jgi:ATP-binding protein involved in chromosome partitioning